MEVIFCFGENINERRANKHFDVVTSQIKNVLFKLKDSEFKKIILAYEPVWAIGTGLVPEKDQIRSAHAFIRGFLASTYGAEAHNVKILYGGSVKGSNAKEIFSISNVDGALVGGASLKSNDFIEIIKAASNSI